MTAAAVPALCVPRAPGCLRLAIERRWDGTPCADRRLHGSVELAAHADGLELAAALPRQARPRVPDAPPGTRVADLWRYDVVECFLVGARGYLEIEFGAGGHFLVLAFSAPRRLADDHADLAPALCHRQQGDGWRTSWRVPWTLVPAGFRALNAFVAAGGALLAHAPLPGERADFHQPDRYPGASLERP